MTVEPKPQTLNPDPRDSIMDLTRLEQIDETCWRIAPTDGMRVPGILCADAGLIRAMDDKVREQICNVARLPGIVDAAYAMPDAHWGYGFPIGGVAAFDPVQGGIVSAGGVGFDISCGVRTLLTGLDIEHLESVKRPLADQLARTIPAGLGSQGRVRLTHRELDAMLRGGARWAVEQGYGEPADLERIEENGCMAGADPDQVSKQAKERQLQEMGTLGSGNHYLEVQHVAEVYDPTIAACYGLAKGDVVVSIHCGSRGLGHQIGTDYLKAMLVAAPRHGLTLPDRELACAPLESSLGRAYLARSAPGSIAPWPTARSSPIWPARPSSASCPRRIWICSMMFRTTPARKRSTCWMGVHGVFSCIAGCDTRLWAWASRAARVTAPRRTTGHHRGQHGHQLAHPGRSRVGACLRVGLSWRRAEHEPSSGDSALAGSRGGRRSGRTRYPDPQPLAAWVAEEAPGAYKDVDAVVDAAEAAGLAKKVARMVPLICIKG